jgi:hypothetical protein
MSVKLPKMKLLTVSKSYRAFVLVLLQSSILFPNLCKKQNCGFVRFINLLELKLI